MNEYITKDEYEQFINLKSKFIKCLEQCCLEIFEMKYKRRPTGEFCEDYDLYDKNGYFLRFESYSCGENSYDDSYVPTIYLYDELFRQNYGSYLDEQRRIKEETKKIEEQEKKDENTKNREMRDRAEYIRLKRKYENSEQWK